MTPPKTKKLFISYRSTDSKKVDPIVARLRSRQYIVWQDKDSIPVGQDWWEAICEGIMGCDVFLFMVSAESIKSFACLAELSFAHKLNLPVIPFVLEGEWIYNAGGKYDIRFWGDIPPQLQDNDNRAQFLFYEGVTFLDKLEQGIAKILEKNLPRFPAEPPPDPRHATDASNNSTVIYDEAYDFAFRGEFDTAEKLFRKLVNRKDAIFGDISLQWVNLINDYERIKTMVERKSTRSIARSQWAVFTQKFPIDFIDGDGIFDPGNISQMLQQATEAGQAQSNPTPAPPRTQGGDTPPEPEYVTRLRTFSGKKNADWTPYITTFPDLRIPKMEFCLVPGGTFMMGNDPEGQYWDDEKKEWITSVPNRGIPTILPYWIARYPVTNAQWKAAVKAEVVAEPKGDEALKWYNNPTMLNAPVVGISWLAANEFCKWLGVRLPTEPEWEYAARGVDCLYFPWGNDFRPRNAVYYENAGGEPNIVTSKPQGESWIGAMHLSGNVWEWCSSEYLNYQHHTTYISGDRKKKMYVLRGGSYLDYPLFLRSTYSFANYKTKSNRAWGVRLAISYQNKLPGF